MDRISFIAAIFLIVVMPVRAATYVETLDSRSDGISRVWIDDHYARMSMKKQVGDKQSNTGQPGEVLVDLKKHQIYIIDHKSKSLVQMTDMPGGQVDSPDPQVKVSFERKGKGPDVAGMATQKYLVSANGQKCFSAYYSRDITRNKQIVAYYKALLDLSALGQVFHSLCDVADSKLNKLDVGKFGITMKILDKNDKVVFEVRKIAQGLMPPKHYLRVPTGYKIRSMQALMQLMQMHMQAPQK